MRRLLILTIAGVAVTVSLFSCKVVKHSELQKKSSDEEVTFYFESEDFDAAAYVSDNWESRVVPEIRENALPLEELLSGLKSDYDNTVLKYGVQKEDTSPHTFAVKAEAVISEVDTESSAGVIIIEIPDLTNDGFCKIQIGPVIKKSMVRDYLSFIKFGDFENQIEFANVSRELNFYIRDNIVNKINEDYKQGSIIDFTGVFTYDKTGAVLITPIEITLVSGNGS